MAKHDPREWIEARRRFHLSHAEVQMARELGLNPAKLGKIANHRQEPWKQPLPAFLAELYRERFGRARPAEVHSLEERERRKRARRAEKKAKKRARLAGAELHAPPRALGDTELESRARRDAGEPPPRRPRRPDPLATQRPDPRDVPPVESRPASPATASNTERSKASAAAASELQREFEW